MDFSYKVINIDVQQYYQFVIGTLFLNVIFKMFESNNILNNTVNIYSYKLFI